ncbi:Hypothetical Protein NTJ_00214 [Nesidiocoris tenuis]|nr:Hypothetical Protein NTJ_00214 [Nesidiocoris tenuis]
MTSSRLLRYATFLSAFDYEVVFKDGESNVNADCFSRAPVNQRSSSGDISINDEVQDVCMNSINQISTEILNSDSIRKETVADVELMDIKAKIETDPELALEYTLDNGILFKGQRVIVPKILRNAVLQELHRTHIGISKMKQLARRYVYWKGIDNDIEHLSRSCEPCAKMKSSPPKAQVHPWDEPQNNWDRIHIDYAGPFQGFWFLIVMDSKSRWAEIKICRTAPTSTSTIEMLSEIFSVHGYPYVMVSDNASIFVSDQFQTFCSAKGIFQKLIAPGHPATNGLAERNVYTLKSRLKAMSEDPAPMQSKIREILFRYRMTPLANNSTPAENYLGRKVRCELDALRPLKHSKNLVYDFHARQLSVGDRVQARYFQRNSNLWKFGSVVRKLGRLHYLIRLDEQPNGVVKRHINQLRRTDVNRKSVTFNDNVEAPDNHPPTTPQGRLYEDVEFYPTHHQPQRNPDNGDNSSLQNQPVVSNQPLQPELRRSGRVRSAPNYLRDYVTS